MPRRRALLAAALLPPALLPATLGALPLAALPLPALAQWKPERPVRVIVPFAAGGNTDVVIRTVIQPMGERMGRPIVVENRAGGAGSLGAELAARAAPDGTTLLAGSGGSMTAAPVLQARLPYDPLTDFAPIGLVATVPIVLVLGPKLDVTSWDAMLARAKARPGTIDLASPAVGSTAHFALELLNHATGANLTHVPYRGGGSLVADLIAGTFDASLLELSTALPLATQGKVRILAVASERRVAQIPEVPTFIERGVAGFTATSFTALLLPARAAPEVVEAWHQALLAALADRATAEKLAGLGTVPAGREEASPAGLATHLREEIARYRRAADLAGLKPQ
jgi:tripartite-type tricarboxylate transporter receptor subunit TctC